MNRILSSRSLVLVLLACSMVLAVLANRAMAQSREAPGVWVPGAAELAAPGRAAPELAAPARAAPAMPAVPDVSLYAQFGAGVLLRERNEVIEPTFTQRVTFGLTLGGYLRIGVVFHSPMFIETYTQPLPGAIPSNSSNTGSYLGGVEVAVRTRLDRFALHAGMNATVGAGEYYIGTPTGSALIWPVAFFSNVFVAAGIAATGNWDVLLRADVGVRAREVGPTDVIAQGSLAFDWH